jgi:hypothetical protein
MVPAGAGLGGIRKRSIIVSTQPGIKILYTGPPERTENAEKAGFPLLSIRVFEEMGFRCFGFFRWLQCPLFPD